MNAWRSWPFSGMGTKMVYNSVVQILDAASETDPTPTVALYNCFTTKKIILRAELEWLLNLIYSTWEI